MSTDTKFPATYTPDAAYRPCACGVAFDIVNMRDFGLTADYQCGVCGRTCSVHLDGGLFRPGESPRPERVSHHETSPKIGTPASEYAAASFWPQETPTSTFVDQVEDFLRRQDIPVPVCLDSYEPPAAAEERLQKAARARGFNIVQETRPGGSRGVHLVRFAEYLRALEESQPKGRAQQPAASLGPVARAAIRFQDTLGRDVTVWPSPDGSGLYLDPMMLSPEKIASLAAHLQAFLRTGSLEIRADGAPPLVAVQAEPRPPACERCRFWEPDGPQPLAGVCRFSPPGAGSWPKTQAVNWCGSFAMK